MYAKLLVLSACVLGFGVLAHGLTPRHFAVANVNTAQVVLVPTTLGGAAQVERWRNPGAGSIVEVGALFAAGVHGAAPVILDFFRGYPHGHNGIGCFLNHGETLISEQLRRIETANESALFDVALLRTENQLRLVAATECAADGCAERAVLTWKALWQQGLRALTRSAPDGVVPAAIILTHPLDAGISKAQEAAVAMQLRAELERVIANVDLEPAMRLAKAQAGQ
ncbi:MAG TPA: hypothetical protein VFM97_06575 [Gammaproteobacteria bacterium]|nr:hypothetical protein [Gammaproteobacteria bacterium]